MKKYKKAIIYIIILFVVILASLIFWQRHNISAFINSMRYSSNDLSIQLDNKREDTKKKIEKHMIKPIDDLSSEDEEKLFKGEITIDEVLEKYKLPSNNIDEGNQISTKDENSISNDLDNSKEIDKAISDGVSKMYALKAKFVSKLGELERTIVSEYLMLPKENQNASGKKDIITKNIKLVAEMEEKCDNEVGEVLTNLEKQLNELKGNKEIIKILKESYQNEKEIKKAYYLSMYNKKN